MVLSFYRAVVLSCCGAVVLLWCKKCISVWVHGMLDGITPCGFAHLREMKFEAVVCRTNVESI